MKKIILTLFYILLSTSSFGGNNFLKKPHLKILDIGNSYTEDATAYLKLIVDSLNVNVDDMCIYKAYRGGASFRDWYNVYHNKDDANYSISKVVGGLNANVKEGSGRPYDGALFRRLLIEEKWDLIIIHQYSGYSTAYNKWTRKGNDGYLIELLKIIRLFQPQCKLGFLLIHSYASSYKRNAEKSSLKRWNNIASVARKFARNYRVDFVIPYGTAIQNLRTTEYNNSMDLTRDGTHLGMGLARYTAACCYYETLIAPRTGVSMLGAKVECPVEDDPKTSKISVNTENMITAQKAAKLACMFPYSCNNPNNYSVGMLASGKIGPRNTVPYRSATK